MREALAKKKQCCMPFPCGKEREGWKEDMRYCVASDCMAWNININDINDGVCKHLENK